MEKPEEKKSITHLMVTVSVTFTGEDQQPLMAARVLADGREIELPFTLLIGDHQPLTVARGMNNPNTRLLYARALHNTGVNLSESIIAELEAASKGQRQQETAGETAPPPSLDTEVNQ